MPRLIPLDWKILECIFLNDGFVFKRQEGSHRAYKKPTIMRRVIIPTYKSVGVDIILNNLRTAKMTRDRYFELLDICRHRG